MIRTSRRSRRPRIGRRIEIGAPKPARYLWCRRTEPQFKQMSYWDSKPEKRTCVQCREPYEQHFYDPPGRDDYLKPHVCPECTEQAIKLQDIRDKANEHSKLLLFVTAIAAICLSLGG